MNPEIMVRAQLYRWGVLEEFTNQGKNEEKFIALMMRVFSKENKPIYGPNVSNNEQLLDADEVLFITNIANKYPLIMVAILEFFKISKTTADHKTA